MSPSNGRPEPHLPRPEPHLDRDLQEYVRDVFLPARRHAFKSPKTAGKYRKASLLFSKFLEQKARIGDITKRNVQGFEIWFCEFYSPGAKQLSAYKYSCALRSVLKHADPQRHVPLPCPSKHDHYSRPPADPSELTSGGTWAYLENVFFPNVIDVLHDLTGRWGTQYRRAVRLLIRFNDGNDVPLESIVPSMLDEFEIWYTSVYLKSASLRTADQSRRCIESLLRYREREGIEQHDFRTKHDDPGCGSKEGGVLHYYRTVYVLERDMSKHWRSTLERYMLRFDVWCGGVLLAEISNELVSQFVSLLQMTSIHPRTIKAQRDGVMSVWRAAFEGYKTDKQPSRVRKVKCPRIVPKGWTIEEVKRLLDCTGKAFGLVPNTNMFRKDYFRAIIKAGWETALRLGDVQEVDPTKILPDGRYLLTMHKTGRPHTVRFRPGTVAEIKRLGECEGVDARRPLQWPGSRPSFYSTFRVMATEAGLEGSFKLLRASSASYIESLHPGTGGKHLGHASPEMFTRHYDVTHISQANLPLPPDLETAGQADGVLCVRCGNPPESKPRYCMRCAMAFCSRECCQNHACAAQGGAA
ncbi:MAG: hypothetical protein WDZ59_11845 [Pirellulales bacterium]